MVPIGRTVWTLEDRGAKWGDRAKAPGTKRQVVERVFYLLQQPRDEIIGPSNYDGWFAFHVLGHSLAPISKKLFTGASLQKARTEVRVWQARMPAPHVGPEADAARREARASVPSMG